jgi:endonuclease/exonuclease/phosphatase family metal-dependent hydrolase
MFLSGRLTLGLVGVLVGACSFSGRPRPEATEPRATATAALTPTVAASQTPTARPSQVPDPTATRSASDEFLDRPSPNTLRVMTYNINWDSIFPADDPQNHELREFSREGAFGRILRAVRPDILCLQEINYLRGAADLGEFLGQQLDPPEAERWQVINVRDTVIASRFGLLEEGYELVTGSVLPDLDQAAGWVDLPDAKYGTTDLYLICAHFKAGGNLADILLRGRQADAIIAHVGDFTTPGGELDLVPGTPYLILGDFNVYDTDPALHLRTLLRGDITNEDRYGPDVQPDWDGSALSDALPGHNGLGRPTYTWRNDGLPFSEGALDRVIFSDSVLVMENGFVLNTLLLADQALAAHGLELNDVLLDASTGYFDHLPVVVDFAMPRPP